MVVLVTGPPGRQVHDPLAAMVNYVNEKKTNSAIFFNR
jgi:Tfp pilus assembly pilus retraction ATPase PilT